MSRWFRAVRVCVPEGREEQFIAVYRHHGWRVEDMHELDPCRGRTYKLWIPETKVSEVRSEGEKGDFVDVEEKQSGQ